MVVPAHSSIHEQFQLLVSLTRLHMLQEYQPTAWLDSDAQTCEFFRGRVPARPAAPSQAVAVRQEQRPMGASPSQPQASAIPVPPPKQPLTPMVAVREEKGPLAPPAAEALQPTKESGQADHKKFQANFGLTPQVAVQRDDMSDWRRILTDVAPKIPLIDTVLPEAFSRTSQAKDFKALIFVEIHATLNHQLFLRDLAQALTLHDIPTRLTVVDSMGQWRELMAKAGLRLILASSSIQPPDNLSTPWLSMPNLENLMQEPDKKAALWHSIHQKLVSSHES